MKIQTSTDYMTGNVSVWLFEDDGADINTYWMNEGQMVAYTQKRTCCEISNDIKPFLVVPQKMFSQIMKAFVKEADILNIRSDNELSFDKIIEVKDDHLEFAEQMCNQLLKKIK